ncbi:hypothetical protein BDW74DRAFT_106879 [Aspergillus multicolor]|uniref:uncharacterized protein n=1 Tax=Aspergillus multicolor TaxID=41759 RepID=UPI003CCDEE1F
MIMPGLHLTLGAGCLWIRLTSMRQPLWTIAATFVHSIWLGLISGTRYKVSFSNLPCCVRVPNTMASAIRNGALTGPWLVRSTGPSRSWYNNLHRVNPGPPYVLVRYDQELWLLDTMTQHSEYRSFRQIASPSRATDEGFTWIKAEGCSIELDCALSDNQASSVVAFPFSCQ